MISMELRERLDTLDATLEAGEVTDIGVRW
jgi:hypothetical protein